ncbi:MAG: hypothetical protein ACFB0D_06760 [Phormidesmis sp.]
MKVFSKRLFWLLLVVMIGLSGWLQPVNASGSDPRLIQLEFEVSALQNQVAQLRSQIDRSPNTAPQSRPAERLDIPSALPGDLPLNAQFDNLATLVIEINQRVIAIEDQIADSSS